MTDQELDTMMKRVLIDLIKHDCEAEEGNGTLAFRPSAHHQRQMRLMVKDPLGWARKKARPMWKTIESSRNFVNYLSWFWNNYGQQSNSTGGLCAVDYGVVRNPYRVSVCW